MRFCSLTHLLEQLRLREGSRRIVVLGSSSLLVFHPELGECGGALDLTYDADFLLEAVDRDLALSLGAELGENKKFHIKFGYHADILHPSIVETLPPGWEERLVAMEGFENVFALEPLDLATVKVVVGREKDLELVGKLLELGIITPDGLSARWISMGLGERELIRSGRNLHSVLEEHREKTSGSL
jgi:hypothetical protein